MVHRRWLTFNLWDCRLSVKEAEDWITVTKACWCRWQLLINSYRSVDNWNSKSWDMSNLMRCATI